VRDDFSVFGFGGEDAAMVPSSTSSSGAIASRRANSSSLMGWGGPKGQQRVDLLRRKASMIS